MSVPYRSGGGDATPSEASDPGVVTDLHRTEAIRRTLRAVREHLGLDVAFVSEFVDGRRVFRFVDSGTQTCSVQVGDSDPLEDSYCHYVVTEQLPQFLVDPTADPVASALAVTSELPVGTHFSVPINLSDGSVFGTFCCFGHDVHSELGAVDLRAVRMMAALVGEYVDELESRKTEQRRRVAVIEAILSDPKALTMAFQPLVDITSGRIVALEALSRFTGSEQGPAWFFAEAKDVGLGVELELKAIEVAVRHFPQIPSPIRFNVNVSPETLESPALWEAISGIPPDRLVVEVTEHAAVHDQDALRAAGDKLTAAGIRMSIDDVGAGFSGLSRILETGADELKMDRSIVRDVHADPVKQAMIEALVGFCDRTRFELVAEGIETREELEALHALGVGLGQGYFYARPGPIETFAPNEMLRPRVVAPVRPQPPNLRPGIVRK